MELDEVLYNRDVINTKLRDILDRETDQWGVKVERVEIKEVDPVEAVKNAMTEQTAAERARRAAILRADGEKAFGDPQGRGSPAEYDPRSGRRTAEQGAPCRRGTALKDPAGTG